MKYYDSSKYPHIVSGFVSAEDCDKVVSYADSNPDHFLNDGQSHEFWSNRTINWYKIRDEEVKRIVLDISAKTKAEIESVSQSGPLFPDLVQIVKWTKGYILEPHADCEEPDGSSHPFPWRNFGTIVYLNDDYVGGEIHYPNKGISHPPHKGELAIHPGTVEYLHGVREVTSGTRYTIASFYTYEMSKTCLHHLIT